MTSDFMHAIPGSDEVLYISEFVTEDEEKYLLRKIEETPEHRWKTLANRRLQVLGGEVASSGVLMSQPLPEYLIIYPSLISRISDTGLFARSKHAQPNHCLLNEYMPGQGIMPHEDGPAYYPTVTTLSLGSHTVMNYYRYVPYNEDLINSGGEAYTRSGGGPVDPNPIISLLLEPRSLVVTRSKLYTDHLHGIDATAKDVFIRDSRLEDVSEDEDAIPISNILNRSLVSQELYQRVMNEGGELDRLKRISLTFRDVEKVFDPRFR